MTTPHRYHPDPTCGFVELFSVASRPPRRVDSNNFQRQKTWKKFHIYIYLTTPNANIYKKNRSVKISQRARIFRTRGARMQIFHKKTKPGEKNVWIFRDSEKRRRVTTIFRAVWKFRRRENACDFSAFSFVFCLIFSAWVCVCGKTIAQSELFARRRWVMVLSYFTRMNWVKLKVKLHGEREAWVLTCEWAKTRVFIRCSCKSFILNSMEFYHPM